MRRSLPAALAGALSLTASLTARADHTSLHATIIGNIAATDNVESAGDDGNREADLFVQVRPGVLLGYETPRMIHELTADVEALQFVRTQDAPSVNYHVGYRTKLDPTPRTSIAGLVNATSGVLNQLSSRSAPDQGGVAATPSGKVDVRQGDASELYSYAISPDTRFLQTALARYAQTDDHVALAVTSEEVGATLGADHTWRGDALGVEAGVSLLHLERLGPQAGVENGVDRLDKQINPHATVQWRHDVNKRWSTNLAAGAVLVNPYGIDPHNPLDMTRTRQLYPVVNGVVAYTDDWGRAQLSAGRAVAPNLFIAENTVVDSAIAQVALPLWLGSRKRAAPQYLGQASFGYAHTQLIDTAGAGEIGTFDVIHGDVGIAWTPRPGMAYGVRYEYFRQLADAATDALFASYSRSTLFVTFAVRWPEQVTVELPQKTQSTRADGSDTAPIGQEVVVPDDATDGQDRRGQGGGGNQGGNGTGGTSANTSGAGGISGTPSP